MEEYIKKSDILGWLVKKKKLFDRCAEVAQTTNNITMMLNEEDSELTKQIIEHVASMPTMTINGETSDGYHTFNELYHHRAVLFSVIVSSYPDLAWKSKKHHDGTMFDGMFIVGIDTPKGQATYHYDIEPYWNVFKCKELENAPEWDGHTPEEAIKRIGLLRGYRSMVKKNDQNGRKPE